MEEEVNAVEAARMTGLSDRTIRRKIKARLLPARPIGPNRYAIKVSDLEALKGHVTGQQADDITAQLQALSERLDHLEASHVRLEQGISDIEQGISEIKTLLTSTSFKQVAPRIPYTTSEPAASRPAAAPSTLPPGALTAKEFAELHSVNYFTFRDHIMKGIGGEILHVSERPKPGRPHETERYLTTEEQEAALDFWRRHGVAFSLPDQPAQKE